MTRHRTTVFAVFVAATAVSAAHADDFIFDYRSDMVCGSGTLSGVVNGNGWLTILGGNLNVASGVYAGSYNLIGNANGTSPIISPSGYFIYDNQLSPNAPATLNVYGLLFGRGATEINIWGTGANNPYTFYAHGNAGNVSTGGEFTVTAVPAPGAIALASLGVISLGIGRKRG